MVSAAGMNSRGHSRSRRLTVRLRALFLPDEQFNVSPILCRSVAGLSETNVFLLPPQDEKQFLLQQIQAL